MKIVVFPRFHFHFPKKKLHGTKTNFPSISEQPNRAQGTELPHQPTNNPTTITFHEESYTWKQPLHRSENGNWRSKKQDSLSTQKRHPQGNGILENDREKWESRRGKPRNNGKWVWKREPWKEACRERVRLVLDGRHPWLPAGMKGSGMRRKSWRGRIHKCKGWLTRQVRDRWETD